MIAGLRNPPLLQGPAGTGICQALHVEANTMDALLGACMIAAQHHPLVVGYSIHGRDEYLELHFRLNANSVRLSAQLEGDAEMAAFCADWLAKKADYGSAPIDDAYTGLGEWTHGFQAEVGGAVVGDQACAIRVRPWWILRED